MHYYFCAIYGYVDKGWNNEDVVTGNEGSIFRETKHVFYFSLGFFSFTNLS